MPTDSAAPLTVIYQSAKLGDIPHLLRDVSLAQDLVGRCALVESIWGASGGALAALFHGLAVTPLQPAARQALSDLERFLRAARSRDIRAVNWRGLQYGIFCLDPLKRWLIGRLRAYTGRQDVATLTLADLAVPVYLCVQDRDGFPVFFGPPNDRLRAVYHSCATRIEDAPVLDACLAALSTMLSTDAYPVNGHYYKDARPAFPDISAMVIDMGAAQPESLAKNTPYTPLLGWRGNAISQVFIMHRWHERNQVDLTGAYNDLVKRRSTLQAALDRLAAGLGEDTRLDEDARARLADGRDPGCPRVLHTDIPYLGSTEAMTNLRDGVAHKAELMQQFRDIGVPQLAGFDFSRPFNVVYGAGGFSGILAGLVMTRAVDAQSDHVRHVFGCSAGVLNGLFHAVAIGARRRPDLYTRDALDAVTHLETFFEGLDVSRLARWNRTPRALVRALANWGPLREQLCRFLERWTGRTDSAAITFEDIHLPLYTAAARGSDGYIDLMGMPQDLHMRFAGRVMRPVNCPIVDAITGGMSQPFYLTPAAIHGETYFDGGGAFYDIGLFTAAMEPEPISQLDLHFAEPPHHSYGFDERLKLPRILLDTHNFTLPEDRRRMRAAVSLFYETEALRRRLAHLVEALRQAGQEALLAGLTLPDLNVWKGI